jgi:hypothetical protein
MLAITIIALVLCSVAFIFPNLLMFLDRTMGDRDEHLAIASINMAALAFAIVTLSILISQMQ